MSLFYIDTDKTELCDFYIFVIMTLQIIYVKSDFHISFPICENQAELCIWNFLVTVYSTQFVYSIRAF